MPGVRCHFSRTDQYSSELAPAKVPQGRHGITSGQLVAVCQRLQFRLKNLSASSLMIYLQKTTTAMGTQIFTLKLMPDRLESCKSTSYIKHDLCIRQESAASLFRRIGQSIYRITPISLYRSAPPPVLPGMRDGSVPPPLNSVYQP